MKINKLHTKHLIKKTLGYTFMLYYHTDNNNNTCFTLSVQNKILKIKEHAIFAYPTYTYEVFGNKIKDYMFDVIEQSINLKIDNLGLTDVLYVEKNTNSFIVHKVDDVLYEQIFLSYHENYDGLYDNLENIIINYKNFF